MTGHAKGVPALLSRGGQQEAIQQNCQRLLQLVEHPSYNSGARLWLLAFLIQHDARTKSALQGLGILKLLAGILQNTSVWSTDAVEAATWMIASFSQDVGSSSMLFDLGVIRFAFC